MMIGRLQRKMAGPEKKKTKWVKKIKKESVLEEKLRMTEEEIFFFKSKAIT